jgi:arginase
MKKIKALGCALGAASNDVDTALGPWYLSHHPEFLPLDWASIHHFNSKLRGLRLQHELFDFLSVYGLSVAGILNATEIPLCIGGDQSMAMGTWPKVIQYCQESLGLIWVDAHLDAHTPESSQSKNFHGMPVAYLLGLWGEAGFHFKPEDIIIIGARSYEASEKRHLQDLGVKIYWQEDIDARGIVTIMEEAYMTLKKNHAHLGLSIDLDAFEPEEIPGVGYREPNGISAKAFLQFMQLHQITDFICYEIAEFNPIRDIENQTARFIGELVAALKV